MEEHFHPYLGWKRCAHPEQGAEAEPGERGRTGAQHPLGGWGHLQCARAWVKAEDSGVFQGTGCWDAANCYAKPWCNTNSLCLPQQTPSIWVTYQQGHQLDLILSLLVLIFFNIYPEWYTHSGLWNSLGLQGPGGVTIRKRGSKADTLLSLPVENIFSHEGQNCARLVPLSISLPGPNSSLARPVQHT